MAETNTGNAAIAGVVVTDAFTGDEAPVLVGGHNSGDIDGDDLLDVNVSCHDAAGIVVTHVAVVEACDLVISAVVTGTGATGDDDDATVPVAQIKTLHIE